MDDENKRAIYNRKGQEEKAYEMHQVTNLSENEADCRKF